MAKNGMKTANLSFIALLLICWLRPAAGGLSPAKWRVKYFDSPLVNEVVTSPGVTSSNPLVSYLLDIHDYFRAFQFEFLHFHLDCFATRPADDVSEPELLYFDLSMAELEIFAVRNPPVPDLRYRRYC